MFDMKLLMYGGMYGILGLVIKVIFALVCIGIILIVLKKERTRIFCKKCNAKVSMYGKICKKCGAALTDENQEIIVRKNSKKMIGFCIAVPLLMIASAILIVVIYSEESNFLFELSGSPGIYVERHESGNAQDLSWSVECQALTKGKLKKVINKNNRNLKELIIENNTKDGNMTLSIEQNDLKESINIENGGEDQIIDLGKYSDDEIRLTVEHDKAESIDFQFEWK